MQHMLAAHFAKWAAFLLYITHNRSTSGYLGRPSTLEGNCKLHFEPSFPIHSMGNVFRHDKCFSFCQQENLTANSESSCAMRFSAASAQLNSSRGII